MKSNKKTALIILDGWGIGKDADADALQQANTPYIDQLSQKYPSSTLVTYGEEVGLPSGQMGNSEVGHLNLGAGRVVYQDLAKINKAIQEDTLKENAVLLEAIQYAKEKKVKFHILGLLSDGGVHSHINHLTAIIDILEQAGVPDTFIHAFMDGRDTSPTSGKKYIKALMKHLKGKSTNLGTMIGRYYAMDRDKRWERIQQAYDLLVHNTGNYYDDAITALDKYYKDEIYDEFVPATVIHDGSKICDGDVVFFINYRNDRPRQLTTCLTQENFVDFGMTTIPLHFLTMTPYDKSYEGVHIVFDKDNIPATMGEVLSNHDRTQVRIAETEKYPHVTFFFSGGREKPFTGEHRILVNSPKVATYDLQPEMSAVEVTDAICAYIESSHPDFICLNYANTDMVGHTGDMGAAIVAAQTVDQCLSRLVPLAIAKDYDLIIIADHGNADIMSNSDGSPHTAHTTNPVPMIYVHSEDIKAQIRSGKLGDLAPTLLGLMDIEVPTQMDGNNLITKES